MLDKCVRFFPVLFELITLFYRSILCYFLQFRFCIFCFFIRLFFALFLFFVVVFVGLVIFLQILPIVFEILINSTSQTYGDRVPDRKVEQTKLV